MRPGAVSATALSSLRFGPNAFQKVRFPVHPLIITTGHEQPLVGAWPAAASYPKRVSNALSSNSTNSALVAGELAGGSMNPQHLKRFCRNKPSLVT